MKREDLYKNMDGIDDKILVKYENYKATNKIVNFRRGAVIAASFCVLALGVGAFRLATNVQTEDEDELMVASTFNETYEESAEEKTEEAIEGASAELGFSISVYASENNKTLLESGKTIPLTMPGSYGTWGFSETEDDGLHFFFRLPKITVEGEGIATVQYSINKHNLSLSQKEKSQENEAEMVSGRLKQYTLTYDEVLNSEYKLAIEDTVTPADEKLLHAAFEPDTWQEKLDLVQGFLDGTAITCTVTYEDGSVESADIVVGAEYHTYDEIEDNYDDSCKQHPFEEGNIIITYTLQ